MNSDPRDHEPIYADRTDDVDTKVEILRRALRAGNYELALGVADSIKDTVASQRMLDAAPGPADLLASNWRPTEELPEAWARWAAGWNLCQTLRLTEPIGQARQAEPVDLLVGMPADRVTSPGRELRVAQFDGGQLWEIRSQVYGEIRRGPHCLAHLVFEADVGADGEAVFLVFCGNPAAELPDYPSRMSIRGEGVGLEIETPHYAAILSRQMGQLESLTPKWHLGGLRLSTHGNGHGEPPNLDWAHDYTTAGAYFLKDGRMEATRDFIAYVARDDEWYFGGRPFDASLWMDKAGRVHEGPVPPEQVDHVWGVGFFHHQSRDSMFAIYLDHRLDVPPDVGSVVVDLTWEPAWTPNRLTDVGRQAMGLAV